MPKIADLFSANVPRYTSYPTAPHFHSGIGEAQYRNWLAGLAPNQPLSLYLHIPFCDTLCWFCGCHTSVVNNYGPVRDYVSLLAKEIELVAAAGAAGHPVTHIHWGGGSPTILQVGDIERLNRLLRDRFDVLPDAEFAIEIDPRSLDIATVKALAKAGLTRASIGLQDCDLMVQRAINRIQTDEETITALDMLRGEGVESLNLDLVYGLPRQSLASWESTLDFALWLNPDRFAVFGYAHVPKFKKHQALIPENLLPDRESRFRMAELANHRISDGGYVAIGIDHFAKPQDSLAMAASEGRLSRNFQGYTTDTASTLIGFGTSAIGSLPQGYVQNAVTVPAYRAALDADQLPVAKGVALSDPDRMHRDIITRLMCDLKADLEESACRYGQPLSTLSAPLESLTPMAEDGIVTISGWKIGVRPEWRSATRLVAAAFDDYLPRRNAIHSAAV